MLCSFLESSSDAVVHLQVSVLFRVFSHGAPFLVEMCRDLESHACLLQRRMVT